MTSYLNLFLLWFQEQFAWLFSLALLSATETIIITISSNQIALPRGISWFHYKPFKLYCDYGDYLRLQGSHSCVNILRTFCVSLVPQMYLVHVTAFTHLGLVKKKCALVSFGFGSKNLYIQSRKASNLESSTLSLPSAEMITGTCHRHTQLQQTHSLSIKYLKRYLISLVLGGNTRHSNMRCHQRLTLWLKSTRHWAATNA